jgi:hypothetical protein
MSRWVTRRTIEGFEVAPPRACFDPGTIIAKPGHMTVEECVAMLVAQDERCLGASNKRPIKRGAELVGYIDITEVSPWETPAVPPRRQSCG